MCVLQFIFPLSEMNVIVIVEEVLSVASRLAVVISSCCVSFCLEWRELYTALSLHAAADVIKSNQFRLIYIFAFM